MFNRISMIATGVALACGMAGAAHAAVSAEEAKLLGTVLTPTGAIKEGNKDGTIPACCERIPVPPGFNPKQRADPFANEKPLYSITAKNMAQYADKISEGFKVMLQKYPTFRMDIYPTHRTAAHSKWVLENVMKNATRCKLEKGGVAISKECYGGIPFPIPKNGNEVQWNHVLTDVGHSITGDSWSFVTDAGGKVVMTGQLVMNQEYPYYDPKKTQMEGHVYFRYRYKAVGPARVAGEAIMFFDSTDPTVVEKKAWQYLPGQRRVKLAPDLSYDTPSPTSAGSYTMDDASVFLGQQDRFDFKLLGKKEMFLPSNFYKIQSDTKNCNAEKVHMKGHLNPDCFRWELRRAWVVEGTVKSGIRHTSPKRVFFWDEDTYEGAIADNYDAAGKLQRVIWNADVGMYEVPNVYGQIFGAYDLNSGVYADSQSVPEANAWPAPPIHPSEWSPEALAGGGIR